MHRLPRIHQIEISVDNRYDSFDVCFWRTASTGKRFLKVTEASAVRANRVQRDMIREIAATRKAD